jgi:DNA polymerase III delta subunit
VIILLFGSDSYRRGAKLRELLLAYKNKHQEIDWLFSDLEEEPESWVRARDFLRQPSMFVDSKVLVVKGISVPKEKEWLDVLKWTVQAEKVFVLASEEKKPDGPFAFLAEAPVSVQEFNDLEGAALRKFLEQEAKKLGQVFTAPALDYFYKMILQEEETSWLAVRELQKISLCGLRQPILLNDLRQIIEYRTKTKVFDGAKKILSERNVGEKLRVLEILFLAKEAPAYIFNSLGYQAKGDDVLRLADYDVAIKSGRLDYEEALTDFVIS